MKNKKDAIIAILLIAGIYFGLYIFNAGCPIKFVTGCSCPGCGMTRAWISAAHFDFDSAFYYHPLFLLGPVLILTIFLYDKKKRKLYLFILILLTTLFFVVYFIRLFDKNDVIVTFDLGNNIFFRILRRLYEKN